MTTIPTPQAAVSPWEDDLNELARRRAIAHALGGEEQIARHHANGKLTARERIDQLLDRDSFSEIGILAGAVKYGQDRKRTQFTPSNAVVGVG